MGKTGYLGIDVSKGYADFILLDSSKKVIEKLFQLSDTVEGRRHLKNVIEGWMKNEIKMLYCGVESTGGYENNWYNMLKGMSLAFDLKVARLNPKGVKAVSDAALKRTITDAVSAENIAVYLIAFPDKIQYETKEEGSVFKEGRTQYSFIRMLIKQKVQLLNQLEKVLYHYFPEVLRYSRRRMPSWLLHLLIKYPCATAALKAGARKLSAIKGVSMDKAEAFLGKLGKGESPQVSDAIKHVITRTSRLIIQKDEMIDEEKGYLAEQYKDFAEVQLLQTIPGVGLDTAVLLMLEIEDVNRFETAGKLCSYFGVHPTFKQSGDGMWKVGMSKKGRGNIRAGLYMSGLTGVQHCPILKQIYARFRAQGMNHYQAMGVVMHKLLRMIYGILKSKKPYNVQVDEQNVSRSEEKAKQEKEKRKEEKKETKLSKHRFQDIDIEGPISRRTAGKIIKQIAS
jgi:transposase